jgi:hypothetical protein
MVWEASRSLTSRGRLWRAGCSGPWSRSGNRSRTAGIARRPRSGGAGAGGKEHEDESRSLQSQHGGLGDARRYETRRVLRFMKSIKMNCPSVIVFVKYAFPLQIDATCLTNSTRLRSRASMKVLIMIPERRQLATSR